MQIDSMNIIYDEKTIDNKVAELAKAILDDFKDKDPVIVCLLESSIFFFSDLFQQLNFVAYPDYIICEHDSNDKSQFKLIRDVRTDITGRNVVIVSNINENGSTLHYLMETLHKRNPASLKICCLFDKKVKKTFTVPIDYLGFSIDDQYLVGYGLDYKGTFTNLPVVGTIKNM